MTSATRNPSECSATLVSAYLDLIFDSSGSPVAVAQREFDQLFPSPGLVEHDPEQIWQTQIAVAGEALKKASLTAADIVAIGITNQRETTVVWERSTGRPIHNAIVWQDRRTAAFCDQLRRDGHTDLVRERTGLVIDAYFSAWSCRCRHRCR